MVLDSSTVMTPSLPTFSIASAMVVPISTSLLAEDGSYVGDLFLVLDLLRVFLDLVHRDLDGLVYAALELDGVIPAATDLRPSFEGVGEDRGGRRTVAGDVVRLGGDFLEELSTMFS